MADDDLIYIKHDQIHALGGPVTRAALESIYEPQGWTEANADDIAAHTGAEPEPTPETPSDDEPETPSDDEPGGEPPEVPLEPTPETPLDGPMAKKK